MVFYRDSRREKPHTFLKRQKVDKLMDTFTCPYDKVFMFRVVRNNYFGI